MMQIRRKKAQSHSQIRKEHLLSYFKKRRLEINNQDLYFQSQKNEDGCQFLKQMINKSMLQNQILTDIRQQSLLKLMEKKSIQVVNASNNKNNLLIKRYILGLSSNIFRQKISINQKQALLHMTLPIAQSILKTPSYKEKAQIFNMMGIQIISFYINVIMDSYFCFEEQDQIRIQYVSQQIYLQLLQECFKNQQLPIVYQDLQNYLNIYFSSYSQDCNFNIEKLKRNFLFITQMMKIHNQFTPQSYQFQQSGNLNNEYLMLHTTLFWFYARISYDFNHVLAYLSDREQVDDIIKLIMFGLCSLNNKKISEHCIICLSKIMEYQVVDEDQIEEFLRYRQNQMFKLLLNEIQNTDCSSGLDLLLNIVRNYLTKKKYTMLIQEFFQSIIDICKQKMESQKPKDIQLVETSLNIICLLFIAGTQDLTMQVNKFLVYFKSLNGNLLLEDLQARFSQSNQNIKQMLQIISYNNVQIQSSQNDFGPIFY